MRTQTVIPALIVAMFLVPSAGEADGHKPPKVPRIKRPLTDAGDVTVWSSDVGLDADAGIFPVGGTGQANGGFTIAERSGVQIGIRASERFGVGGALPHARRGSIGVYAAETGESSPGRATWNFDIHLDLRDAAGEFAGTTLDDYAFVLRSNVAGAWLPIDVELLWGGTELPNARLLQISWNPGFFNDFTPEPVFDPFRPWVYEFQLELTPNFSKKPLRARIFVVVEEPAPDVAQ